MRNKIFIALVTMVIITTIAIARGKGGGGGGGGSNCNGGWQTGYFSENWGGAYTGFLCFSPYYYPPSGNTNTCPTIINPSYIGHEVYYGKIRVKKVCNPNDFKDFCRNSFSNTTTIQIPIGVQYTVEFELIDRCRNCAQAPPGKGYKLRWFRSQTFNSYVSNPTISFYAQTNSFICP